MKRKIRRLTIFYWLITVTLVSWCFSMLYIYSWKSSWAGKEVPLESAHKEENQLREKVRILEEMEAPDYDIIETRIALANLLLQTGSHMAARDVLDDAEARLLKNKDGQDADAVLKKRYLLNKMAAIPFRELALYQMAADRYEKISKFLATAPPSPEVELMQLSLLNDQGVLQYLWANSSPDFKDRKKHFELAEVKFQKCSTECRFHLSEPNQSQNSQYKKLVQLSTSNWVELLKDVGRSKEIEAITKKMNEKESRHKSV